MNLRRHDRVAWITGAGKGIGRALARRLANDGWIVCASARTLEDLESLKLECPDGSIRHYVLDVSDEIATRAVLNDIDRDLGVPDLAVLNAGTHTPVMAEDLCVEPFRQLMETNYMGAVHGLLGVLKMMRQTGAGHIAIVSSLAGYRGLPSAAAYGPTKAALINMCEALRPEIENLGIKLQLINPGFVKTPLTDQNDFDMPFLISVEKAVDYIVSGLKSNRFEIAFPGRFAILMKLLRILPASLFFAVTRRMLKS